MRRRSPIGVRQHRHPHGGYTRDDGDLVLGKGIDEGLRVPSREEREGRAGAERGQRHIGKTEDMEQRQARRGPVLRGRLSHLLDDVRRGDEIAQRQHGTLRLSRGARGVEQGGQVIPVEFDMIELGDAVISQPKARPLVADQG